MRGMETLADPKAYKALCARIMQFTEVRTYKDVTEDFLRILRELRAKERAAEGLRVLQLGADRSKIGSLVSGSTSAQRQEAYARVLGYLDDISFTLRSDGFAARATDMMSVNPTNSRSRLLYGFDAMRIASKLPRPDVVSVQDPFEAGLVGWCIARMKRSPLYVQVHTDFLSPAYIQHSILNRIRVWMAGFVLRRASRVRVVSEKIKESVERKYCPQVPVTVMPVYFDAQRFRNAGADPALSLPFGRFAWKLLYVGCLEPEKNVLLALRAFAQAGPQDACLVILGEGSGRVALEDAAHDLGISDRVFFEGARAPDPYYKLADLVLLTSHYEGYPAVVAEALSAGKPVLSTDAGAAREIGAIVAPEEEFADALKEWFASGTRTGELKSLPV